jgi:hypothetical protein
MEPGPLEVGFDSFFGVPFSHNSPPTFSLYADYQILGLDSDVCSINALSKAFYQYRIWLYDQEFADKTVQGAVNLAK